MKIDIYSVMLNERRILPYWLRHYEQFASRIFVWDGSSIDGTCELLESHPLVTTFNQECKGLDDIYFTECFMRYKELSQGVDWCMAVAADEFIFYPNIVDRLAALTANGADKVQLTGYTMYADHFPITERQIYDEIKFGYPDIWSNKTVLFNPTVEMHWTPGLHRELSVELPTRNTGIRLLHYRYLGADYYLERTRRNYAQWKVAGMDIEFDYNRMHNLPDGSRGNPYEWYEMNKNKLVQVVA